MRSRAVIAASRSAVVCASFCVCVSVCLSVCGACVCACACVVCVCTRARACVCACEHRSAQCEDYSEGGVALRHGLGELPLQLQHASVRVLGPRALALHAIAAPLVFLVQEHQLTRLRLALTSIRRRRRRRRRLGWQRHTALMLWIWDHPLDWCF